MKSQEKVGNPLSLFLSKRGVTMKTLLIAISAKNTHKTLAPWCLKAYCEKYCPNINVVIQEHTINDPISNIIDAIYATQPAVLGLSCYIWNIEIVAKISNIVRQLIPQCTIVLGGPEVSFETNFTNYPHANFIVQGAGEHPFAELLNELNSGNIIERKIISAQGTVFAELPTPHTQCYFNSFAEGRMASISNQLVYYESSRGCPFSCSFCISSTTIGVQYLPLPQVLHDISLFVAESATCVKFVDRTFNANPVRATAILQHIQILNTNCTFHFEAAADLFNDELLDIIEQMPSGRIQFEIGIQSTNAVTLFAINRKTNLASALANIQKLVSFGNTHIHVDLIAGLPLETLETFKHGVNRCLVVRPHMLQLGVLKMLKGTKVLQESTAYSYSYNSYPPYQVFSNNTMSYDDLLEIKRVTEAVEKFYNTGMFTNSVEYAIQLFRGEYEFFNAFSLFYEGTNPKSSLKTAYTLMLNFLTIYGDENIAQHYIKLDCLTHDPKGQLPNAIIPHRNKPAEQEYKKNNKSANIRIEYFPYDGTTRMFEY